MLAHYFAKKAQKAIGALQDKGVINNEAIEKWTTIIADVTTMNDDISLWHIFYPMV